MACVSDATVRAILKLMQQTLLLAPLPPPGRLASPGDLALSAVVKKDHPAPEALRSRPEISLSEHVAAEVSSRDGVPSVAEGRSKSGEQGQQKMEKRKRQEERQKVTEETMFAEHQAKKRAKMQRLTLAQASN